MSTLTNSMISHILEAERYTLRFEDLCIDTFGAFQGIQYLRTSRTHDLGRDARAVGTGPELVPPLMACGTGKDPQQKAMDDLSRIMESLKPEHIVFCFTAPVSESLENEIKIAALSKCPSLRTAEVYGLNQLPDIILEHSDAFETLYAGDLANLRQALAIPLSNQPGIDLTGMRIALTTQLHDDAQAYRSDVIRNLILTSLSAGEALTTRQLAKRATDSLHLPRLVNEAWLTLDMNKLADEGLLTFSPDGTAVRITESGTKALTSRTKSGADRLLQGQRDIRLALQDLLGYELADSEFVPVWNTLQSQVATLLASHGAYLIESLVAVLEHNSPLIGHSDLKAHIKLLADSGMAANSPRSTEIATALYDLFNEKSSPAFSWLADTAGVFLQVCALGLEPKSQQQMLSRLKELELMLDTDIVLTLLSPGEPSHAAIKTMVDGWVKIGGSLVVTNAILEETSYHAYIADADYSNVTFLIDKIEDSEALRVIENAFVRGFRHESKLAGQKCTRTRWNSYISAFRGSVQYDFSKILAILQEDYAVGLVEEDPSDIDYAASLAERLFEERNNEHQTDERKVAGFKEKCDRDGRVAATFIRRLKLLKNEGRSGAIISTSKALRHIFARFVVDEVEDECILYAPAIMWLLAQYPGVRITPRMIHSVLLDVDFRERLNPLERKAMRLFCVSEEYSVHYSRRSTLRRAMSSQIRRRAAQSGLSPKDIEEQMLRNDDEGRALSADIIAKAVDEFATSKSEARIAQLEDEIRRLRAENDKNLDVRRRKKK